MENLCHFICSRGILNSCHFRSPTPQSSCNNDTTYLVKMLKSEKMFDGMSIYVCSDLLKFFVSQILPKMVYHFVLVTGDSDMCVPKEALSNTETSILINSPYLTKWFAQNTQIQNHEKIIQLPIGLDYHTISNNPNHNWKTPGENHLPKFQEEILINLRQQMKPYYRGCDGAERVVTDTEYGTLVEYSERIPKIYINFTLNNDRFHQRKRAFLEIPKDLLAINNNFTKRTENWRNITNYTFVLSPFGVGMDCHRTWEALCLGAIPILKAPNFTNMFENLPVLIVNEWSDITQELLDKTIIDFQSRTFNYDKLTLQYWVKQIICSEPKP